MRIRHAALAITCGLLCIAVPLAAQNYDLSWRTIDGGGVTFGSGGGFSLGATMGQPDARSAAAPLAGGNFQLVGGFWSAASAVECALPGDMTMDGLRDGDDLGLFIDCVLGASTMCDCADLDGNGVVNNVDVNSLIAILLMP